MNTINKQRQIIDQVDQEIIDLLAQRFDAITKIGQEKKILNLPPLDQSRWEMVLNSKIELAKRYDLDPEMVKEIYNIIHKYALEKES